MSLSRELVAYAAGTPNKALHRTVTPLRSVAAGEPVVSTHERKTYGSEDPT
jgi:hypothetical protein